MAEIKGQDVFKDAFQMVEETVLEREFVIRRGLSRAHKILEENGVDLTKPENIERFIEAATTAFPDMILVFHKAFELRKSQNKTLIQD